MTAEEYRKYLEQDFSDVNIDEMTDLLTVKADRNKSLKERRESYLNKVGNPYLVRIGNMKVKVRFPLLSMVSMIMMLCAHCGHCLVRETEHLLKCSDGRTSGDHVCRSLVVRREPMEKHILELVHQFASSMLENRKIVESKNQSKDMETNVAELLKQSRQLSSEKMKLYDEYKDDRIDRELYKQKAEKIGRQLEEIRRKIAESERDAKMLEQDNTAKEMKLEEFLNMEKFDTEKLREIIKVIQVHSQEEIEIEWNFDDVFLGQR